jgi:hypothetical protein
VESSSAAAINADWMVQRFMKIFLVQLARLPTAKALRVLKLHKLYLARQKTTRKRCRIRVAMT